jgi:hypothetical protein
MIHLFILAVHLLATVRPGGVRAVVAESLVLTHLIQPAWNLN